MRTAFYINDKKISKKKAEELVGKETLKKRISEAKERFMEEPGEMQSWYIGSGRYLEIRFQ